LKGTVNSYVPPPVATMTEKFLELNEFDMDLRIHDEGRQVPPTISRRLDQSCRTTTSR
jgi:hypothetical protein